MGVVGVSTIGLDIILAVILFVLIEIIDHLVALRERIEEKYGHKPIKVFRITYLSFLLIAALFFGYKYYFGPLVIKPLFFHLDCEIFRSDSQPSFIYDVCLRATPSNAIASSEPPLSAKRANHDASMAIDNDLQTSWWENAKGTGDGQWIRLTYDTPIKVAAITIWPGRWNRNQLYWSSHDHPTILNVSLFCGKREIGEVEIGTPNKECITVILKQPTEIDAVRILIVQGVQGIGASDGYNAISEIAVYEEGPRSYVSSGGMVTNEAIEKMKSQAEDDYADYLAESWGSGEELQSFTYLGYYFLTKKKQDASLDANEVYLLYKCEVTCKGQPFEYYHFIRFRNLIMNSDGTCSVDTDDYDTPSDIVITDYGYYYYGYNSIEDLLNSCVYPKLSSYSFEDSIFG